jgi:hypothetical protein
VGDSFPRAGASPYLYFDVAKVQIFDCG